MADENKIELEWPELFTTMKGLMQGARNQMVVNREVIPIIFVPGIMGTRLKNQKNEKVWDPDDKPWMGWTYLFASAAKKKARLVGPRFSESFLQVFNDDSKHNKSMLKGYPEADKRGWGGVSWNSYGQILSALHNLFFNQTLPRQKDKALEKLLALCVGCFSMPVHAFGYNWTASNSTAGKKLKDYIDGLIKDYKSKDPKAQCKSVILVTHSMGGLVARSACAEHGASSSVLGIVHGVQPATGSPAAYWRMKAGFERNGLSSIPQAWVLGKNGEQVTALLGNMPGGLQLLPSQQYKTNAGSGRWLVFHDSQGREVTALPDGDPYEKIYKNQKAYWRLVNPAHLSPEADEDDLVGSKAVWACYVKALDGAKAFHQKVTLEPQVKETRAFYGSGLKHLTADRIVYRLSERGWIQVSGELAEVASGALEAEEVGGPLGAAAYLGYQAVTRSDWWHSQGGFRTEITEERRRLEIVLQPPDGAGDGTVPESSGKAIHVENKPFEGIEHEPAFRDKGTEDFTIEQIARFCAAKIKKEKR